jgi:hypothetical protein
MAEATSAAVVAASLPTPEQIERAAAFAREPFVLPGETVADALAAGSARRRAFDAALTEIEAGADTPSPEWRNDFSLMLGLERVLAVEEPVLVDGTTLSAHQVDALSGTLTALLTSAQRSNGNGAAVAEDIVPVPAAAPGMEERELDLEAVDADAAELELDDLDEEDDEVEADEPEAEVEEPQDWDASAEADEDQLPEQPEDPNADKRFWFEHATGAGKTVAAVGFVEATRTGGVLILTHRRNLVDQFNDELKTRGYKDRIRGPLLRGSDRADGIVTVETYQWFVRNAGNVSDAYSIVICDEAHTALGEKTSAAIRKWAGPIFIGMTATGALIARHVTDLFPTQTSRFDLAQAARRGVISPLRCVRIPPGPGVRTIAKVPLRKGDVDMEFDQEMLAELLDQLPFNLAVADLYKTRFEGVPGVVYAAGVRHAMNVAAAFREIGLKAMGVSGETPKRELAQILADYERGEIDVLVNAQLLAEGWNSPRATVCMHLAPTASRRIYQQRVGRVTRRHPGKEAGIVVDFVHPGTKHDDPVVTLHSLLDRDVYRGGAIVVGPVRRGRGRRLRVERRVLPVCSDETRRIEVFERELWRIAVEHLDYGEQIQWAALAGARVTPNGWRRARAMLHFDTGGELKRTFLLTAVQRNRNAQLRQRALQEIAAGSDGEAFDDAIEMVQNWPRDEKREGVKIVLQALAEKKIGRRDQANNWIWRCAEMSREIHEEYAVQRWPETKRLLGLLVNSSGGAHARNARRLVHAARQQDRRLASALLAAAVPHTAEAGEVINGARMRMSRRPAALARELLRNFPKGGKGKRGRRRKRKGAAGENGQIEAGSVEAIGVVDVGEDGAVTESAGDDLRFAEGEAYSSDAPSEAKPKVPRSRGRRKGGGGRDPDRGGQVRRKRKGNADPERESGDVAVADAPAKRSRSRKPAVAEGPDAEQPVTTEAGADAGETPKPRARSRKPAAAAESGAASFAPDGTDVVDAPKPRARTRKVIIDDGASAAPADSGGGEKPAPRSRARKTATGDGEKPASRARARARKADGAGDEQSAPRAGRTAEDGDAERAPAPRQRGAAGDDTGDAPKPRTRARKAAPTGDSDEVTTAVSAARARKPVPKPDGDAAAAAVAAAARALQAAAAARSASTKSTSPKADEAA